MHSSTRCATTTSPTSPASRSPNHLHTFAAFSPVIDNTSHGRNYQPQPPFDIQSLPAVLEAAGHSWRDYADSNASYFPSIKALAGSKSIVPSSQFLTDVAAGNLPAVSWLFAPSAFSEHPGGTQPIVAPGMKWTADRVQAIAKSSAWPNTAIFITWDDWGGWYDHVTPPLAQRWAGGGPVGYAKSQFRYGNRVPCLVISPYARQAVNHDFFSHASLVKFCLRLFGLTPWKVPALAPGDPSGDLWSCFDFASPPRLGRRAPSWLPGRPRCVEGQRALPSRRWRHAARLRRGGRPRSLQRRSRGVSDGGAGIREMKVVGAMDGMNAEAWAEKWLDSVAEGRSKMSQRRVASIERHGGGLDAVAAAAKSKGVHLVMLTDDKGAQLVAASVHPFKVLT